MDLWHKKRYLRTILTIAIIFVFSMIVCGFYSPKANKINASTNNIFSIDMLKEWISIKRSLGNPEKLEVKDWNIVFNKDGIILDLDCEITSSGGTHYYIKYDQNNKEYSIIQKRAWINNTPNEYIDADSFFRICSDLKFKDIVSMGEYSNCHIAASGSSVIFNKKDACKLRIEGSNLIAINNLSLPFKGYTFCVTGVEELEAATSRELNEIYLLYNTARE